MKYVWKLADKIYEMGHRDAVDAAKLRWSEPSLEDNPIVEWIHPDYQVSSIDHKRNKEIREEMKELNVNTDELPQWLKDEKENRSLHYDLTCHSSPDNS